LSKRNKTPKKEFASGPLWKPLIMILATLSVALTIFALGMSRTYDSVIIYCGIYAVVAGVILECIRRSVMLKSILLALLGSYCLSFMSFLPGKHEAIYNFEMHALVWPFLFVILFIFFVGAFKMRVFTTQLTEGSTLVLSIAITYWVIDNRLYVIENVPQAFMLLAGLLFLLFSLCHAFTHSALSKTTRLLLSIWSSVVMLLFSVGYIIRVYKGGQVDLSTDTIETFSIILQFFLLGVSAPYIVQNVFMLASFMPTKHNFFNSDHFQRIAETKKAHIERYSDQQVKTHHSLLCVFIVAPAFAVNYYFQIVSSHTAIWLLIFAFPYIVMLYDVIIKGQTVQEKEHTQH
jgi:hypothetical protein